MPISKERLRLLSSDGYKIQDKIGLPVDLREPSEVIISRITSVISDIATSVNNLQRTIQQQSTSNQNVEPPQVTVNIPRPKSWLFTIRQRDETGNIKTVTAEARD